MILRHTCIRAGDDDDLSCQIRDVLYVKLALGRESLTDDRSNNAHVRLGGREYVIHINLLNIELQP